MRKFDWLRNDDDDNDDDTGWLMLLMSQRFVCECIFHKISARVREIHYTHYVSFVPNEATTTQKKKKPSTHVYTNTH